MRIAFMPDILTRIAPKIGAEVLLEPNYGFVGLVRFNNGRKSFFWDNKFNLNPVSSVKICQDKAYTTFFLRKFGYRTPEEQTFARESFQKHLPHSRGLLEALHYARSLGWPTFLKACRLSQGDLIFKAHNEKELSQYSSLVFERSRLMIVQRAYEYNDYRVVVLDGEVISAYQRIPLEVKGDGISTIDELLHQKQHYFKESGRDTIIPFDDIRIKSRLTHLGLSLASVPPPGDVVRLMDIANLSLGGSTKDLTKHLHPTFSLLAARVATDLDLRFCGVDILAPDVTAQLQDYIILEVNSAPGLDNYAFDGVEQRDYVDGLYLRVLEAIAFGPPNPG